MNTCDALVTNASAGVAPALRAVDCLTGQETAGAFARLFGGHGALLSALTLLLTLYIGFFAIALLTGRSRIGISSLTPRMITLGLVLTFATSWAAYQGVIWNLAIGAPDQIAGVLMGTPGSATRLFADRIDIVFHAIAQTTSASAQQGALEGVAPAQSGSFTPDNLIWLAALLLLLGTVGVLLTARIALAVLLVLGPVFVVLALFAGTRGLFAGWLRGVVLTAVTPLFVVLGGGFILQLALPVIEQLNTPDGIDGRAALALFTIAAVHCALMAMVLRVAGTIVTGWTIFGLAGQDRADTARSGIDPAAATPIDRLRSGDRQAPRRPPALVPVAPLSGDQTPAARPTITDPRNTVVITGPAPDTRPTQRRAGGIGSRFRTPSTLRREILR
jgi:type IV secretion system protein VirB6